VSKVIGVRSFKRTIAQDITWTIEPRSRLVVLSHQRMALSVLFNVAAGLSLPTEGWVERRGKISPPGGFIRYSRGGTLSELVKLLAPLYEFEVEDVIEFVVSTVQHDRLRRTPLSKLPASLKRELNMALTFAIPCDYYFFNGLPEVGRPAFRKYCQQALSVRSREATIVVGASTERIARSLGPDAAAAILHRGSFTLYQHLDEALAVFGQLEPEPEIPGQELEGETYEEEPDFIL
jgi:ABC-type polysaccharide/polyol phosphate transport system ATPase subunit